MIVVDASVALEMVLGSRRGRDALALLSQRSASLHAPSLIDLEVVQVLRRLHRGSSVTIERADAAVALLEALPVTRHLTTPLLARIWAHRHHLTAYDASYVALAEVIGASLVTFDETIAAAPGVSVEVLIPDTT